MTREWTKDQENAMNTRGRTLLVSAAAGSGKTAVLTERIIRMIINGEADISRTLIVTFTRAAAGELRQRISGELSEQLLLHPKNKHLSNQLMLLTGAPISTIDSFYLSLVREHFQEAGFPAAFRPADENELLSLRRELMNECIDEMYRSHPDFGCVADVFCDLRDESALTECLLKLYKDLLRYPEGLDILLRSAQDMQENAQTPLQSAWGKIWSDELYALATRGRMLFAELLDKMQAHELSEGLLKKYGAAYTERLDRCRTLPALLECGDYAAARETLVAPFASNVGSRGVKVDESFSFFHLYSLCESFRKEYGEAAKVLGAFSPDEVLQSAEESARIMQLLHTALTRFHNSYFAAKMQREVAEFSDVSRAAYRLLVDANGEATPLALEIAAKYDAVYIDEYQDVDAMQDATFRAISSPTNRFMVGDIKQSIYRFRGAQPAVFASYRKRFPKLDLTKNDKESTVFMSKCFRCDPSVIRFSNTVSGYLFSRCAQSIGYSAEDDLQPRDDFGDYKGEKCRVVLLERDSVKENRQELSPEIRFVAAEIKRLLDAKTPVNGRPITYSDIAVLVRSKTSLPALERELSALHIPVKNTAEQSFFENSDVLCVYSLLAALDNPLRDVHMAAAMRSPFFGFSLEELVRIRTATDSSLSLYEAVNAADCKQLFSDELGSHIEAFVKRFSQWRNKAKNLPVDRLLRFLYRESAILSFAGREGDDDATPHTRRANLRRLYEYARTFESGSFKGLYQFIQYVDGIMENGGTVPPPDGAANAVSLITIHHSKGLEFPVCFLMGLSYSVTGKDSSSPFLHDEHLGCAPMLCNAGPFSRSNTFFRLCIDLSLRKQSMEEEMRVLYVAMTRAKHRLYLTASLTALKTTYPGFMSLIEQATSHKLGDALVERKTAIHWVMAALLRADHDEFAQISYVNERELTTPPTTKTAQQAHEEVAKRGEISALMQERFSFVYPHEHLTRLPAKLSVSKLSPGVLDVYDSEAYSPAELLESDAEQLLHSFERVPLFGAQSSEKLAAARGTATHEFLQFCDFARTEKTGVREELARLIEQRYLPPENSDLVRVDELERFFQSKFYRMLRHAATLRRETRFHLFLPAADFTKDAAFADALQEEQLAVQGVIDLFFTDGEGNVLLCDYKTDRLTPQELKDPRKAAATLFERYRDQLSYYARALTQICGKAPARIWIYSLPFGEALDKNGETP